MASGIIPLPLLETLTTTCMLIVTPATGGEQVVLMNISDSPPKPMTTEERAEKLAYVLRSDTAGGWRVISQTQTSAQLEKGKDTSHLLHFLLGFPTLGLWWITVWPAVTILAGKKSRYVAIDEYGNVTRT